MGLTVSSTAYCCTSGEVQTEARDLVFPLGQHFPNWENKRGVQEVNVKRHSNSKKTQKSGQRELEKCDCGRGWGWSGRVSWQRGTEQNSLEDPATGCQ